MTVPPVSKKRAIGKWIRHLILPLLFVVVTVVLCAKTEKEEIEIAIAVTVNNLADELLLIDASRQSVRLLISGTPSALEAIDPGTTSCRLDLSGLGEGIHTVPVHPSGVSLPKGVALQALLTPSLTVSLEPVSSKSVDVVGVLEGNPASGFAVASVILNPDHIVLKGTASMLAGIDTVKTRPINLEEASESFRKEVPLSLPLTIAVDPPLRIVVAQVEIKERIITRVMENVPVVGKGTSVGHQIQPATLTLTVSGPETVVNAVETDPAFAVTISLAGLTPGTHSLKAAINLPVQTTLVSVSPERFIVSITK